MTSLTTSSNNQPIKNRFETDKKKQVGTKSSETERSSCEFFAREKNTKQNLNDDVLVSGGEVLPNLSDFVSKAKQ